MNSSDRRRQSDSLPSISYVGFEQAAREGTQFHQRHPSITARASVSAVSPISPTTQFHGHSFAPPSTASGYHTPPESRKNSDNQRQSLPSIQEALFDKAGTFSAPSPMQTPPIGSGSFSAAPASSRTNSMPRSQPSDPQVPTPSAAQATLQGYPTSQQPAAAPPTPAHSKDPTYPRQDSLTLVRTLPPNPYSQSQPPPPIPVIQSSEHYQPSAPAPPPPPPQATQYHLYTGYPPPNQLGSPHYQSTSTYPSASGGLHQPASFTPYSQHQQPPYPSQSVQAQYAYSQRDSVYGPNQPASLSPGTKGAKRVGSGGYGSTIERALSISAIRRDLEAAKEHSARIYQIIRQYQEMCEAGGRSHTNGLDVHLRDFAEALDRSYQNTEALRNCHQVFQDISSKESVEQQQYAYKMSNNHGSDYGGDDAQGYGDDSRSNGSHIPDQKKLRRGRAAPPGRCHSCHRAETPEWRRGPDGARTLCNACGLHYAKLTRKLSKNSIGTSTLARKPPSSPLP